MSKRDITELGIKMVDRWTLSCQHATKPSVYPLKIAMAITTRAFSRVQAAVRRRGKACACKVRTYVRLSRRSKAMDRRAAKLFKRLPDR